MGAKRFTPRVHLKKKLVMTQIRSVEMLLVHRMTNNGKVSAGHKELYSYEPEPRQAAKAMKFPWSSSKAIPGIRIEDYKDWNTYVEAVWKKANGP